MAFSTAGPYFSSSGPIGLIHSRRNSPCFCSRASCSSFVKDSGDFLFSRRTAHCLSTFSSAVSSTGFPSACFSLAERMPRAIFTYSESSFEDSIVDVINQPASMIEIGIPIPASQAISGAFLLSIVCMTQVGVCEVQQIVFIRRPASVNRSLSMSAVDKPVGLNRRAGIGIEGGGGGVGYEFDDRAM
jgi:hypothetical protein